MRDKVRRHLGALLGAEPAEGEVRKFLRAKVAGQAGQVRSIAIPPEFTPRQYAILLLSVAAEIEHALMVEYMYAAYSLGGPDVHPERRIEVAQWQETILGIAKEEMGHLMTVQNLLRCLGGPLNLDREDYPWDSEFYPFRFELRPLTLKSLAKYVYAESPAPEDWKGKEADDIRRLAQDEVGKGAPVHRVGALYSLIASLLQSPDAVKDADFRGSTYPFQSNWDEWGRGYKAGARGNATGGSMSGTPDLIILPIASRTDALAAIQAVASQGEANTNDSDSAPSHFARFLKIYRQFPKDAEWKPTRNVPSNPYVTTDSDSGEDEESQDGTPITHPAGMLWGHLFNVRYRLLLTNLMHCFEYPSNISTDSQSTPRGLLVHATFGEMYNIRAISQILVQTPLHPAEPELKAGPPFQVPYTLKLPVDVEDRWHLHLDLLEASAGLAGLLSSLKEAEQHKSYLIALQAADQQTRNSIEAILRRHSNR
jgi:Ferritin-like